MVLDGKYVVFEPPQPAASSSVVALRLNRNSPNGFPRFDEEGSTGRFPAAAPMSPVGQLRTLVTYLCHVRSWGISRHGAEVVGTSVLSQKET